MGVIETKKRGHQVPLFFLINTEQKTVIIELQQTAVCKIIRRNYGIYRIIRSWVYLFFYSLVDDLNF